MSDVINGVPRELLERIAKADSEISGLQMGVFEDACDQMDIAMTELRALLTAQPQASAAQSAPAGEREAVEVVGWRIGFPNGSGYKLYEQHQPWAYEEYGPVSYEVQDLMTVAQHERILASWQRAQSAPAGADDLQIAMQQRDHYASRVETLELGMLRIADDFQPSTDAEVALALDEMREAIRGLALAAAPQPAARDHAEQNLEMVQHDHSEVQRLREALEFYARGDHLLLADSDAWDTCSGEPMNWLHDDEGTCSVEDGSLAKAALSAQGEGERQPSAGGDHE